MEKILILQFYNHKSYCPDFVGQQETVYHILVANDDDNIEKVLAQLVHRKHWKIYANYSEEFGVSDCIDYLGCKKRATPRRTSD